VTSRIRQFSISALLLGLAHLCMNAGNAPSPSPLVPSTDTVPSLPDRHGFAGMFAGVAGGHLLCAGGANFPDKPLQEGGKKVWHNQVFALAAHGETWAVAGRLPRPNAYGVSATWRGAVALVGGGDHAGNFSTAALMRYDGQNLTFEPLPSLPYATANACGALVGDLLYIAGGQESPDASSTLRRCLVLDLAAENRKWREVSWPDAAAGRILAVAGTDGKWFYLFGGTDLSRDASGAVVRCYLKDAWRYHPEAGWQRLADLPNATAASPANAMLAPDQALWIVGGVSPGFLTQLVPGSAHPGFPRQLLRYSPAGNRWTEVAFEANGVPARVTAPLVQWDQRFVIPSGEIAPGIRTPTVQAFQFTR